MKKEIILTFTFIGFFIACIANACLSLKDISQVSIYVPTPYKINVPFFPDSLNIPVDNPLTVEGIELGRYLFYDGRLSGNTRLNKLMSCATCHIQAHSFECGFNHPLFKEGHPQGLSGIKTPHVMMPLINLAWINEGYLWNGSVSEGNSKLGSKKYGVPADSVFNYKNIESLVWMAITAPYEMNGSIQKTVKVISKVPMYPPMFKRAFGTEEVTIDRICRAIAQFVRTLISFNSKMDQFMEGKVSLTKQELRGLSLFTTELGDCFHCHGSPAIPLWTTNLFMNNAKDLDFTNNFDRHSVTRNIKDKGKYRVPTLRNIAYTAPYMHDGRFKTLDEVLEFYNNGLKRSPYVDPLMISVNHGGMHLTTEDLKDLKSFLLTLSDTSFITNPAFSNPRPNDKYFINNDKLTIQTP
jgi:cytochrome c peroxidase